MPRRPSLNKADRKPTVTKLVLDALQVCDDFLSLELLRAATGANNNQITAALHHLQKRKAVDCVVGPDDLLWWFATGEDDRQRIVEERVAEPPGNRTRRGRKPKTEGWVNPDPFSRKTD